jgi:hypothetical protein
MDTADTARERVFETQELFEGILSFLPFKKLFYIRTVSKHWADEIDGSVTLQQKMFLKPRDQPELWIVERKHKPGANNYGKRYNHLNDTELKFRRVKPPEDDGRPINPVTLNPLLEDDNNTVTSRSNILRMAVGCDFEEATYRGWTDAFRDQDHINTANASFWNTFLTDPPYHKVEIQLFALRLDDARLPVEPSNARPVLAAVVLSDGGGLPVASSAGVRMRDVLLASLTARSYAIGGCPVRWLWKRCDATVLDAVEAMKQAIGGERIAKRWGVFFRLRLCRVGDAHPLLATDEERAAANKD